MLLLLLLLLLSRSNSESKSKSTRQGISSNSTAVKHGMGVSQPAMANGQCLIRNAVVPATRHMPYVGAATVSTGFGNEAVPVQPPHAATASPRISATKPQSASAYTPWGVGTVGMALPLAA